MGIQQLPRRSARDDVLYMRSNVGGGEGDGGGGEWRGMGDCIFVKST